MAALGSMQLGQVRGLGSLQQERFAGISRRKWQSLGLQLPGSAPLGCGGRVRTPALLQDPWCTQLWRRLEMKPAAAGCHVAPVPCASASLGFDLPVVKEHTKQASLVAGKALSVVLARTVLILKAHPTVVQTVPAVGLIAFSVWGLGPFVRQLRKTFFQKNEKSWENSLTQYLMASYIRPILLWVGVIVICRAVDPLVLSTEASNAIKQRFVNFVRSLSTVLAFAVCTASLTQQIQKIMMERQDSQEARNVGVQFIGNTVYTSVWVAAVCLFMELLGFSTQKWITAGGFGTVLLTLAGREIFTNFLSSVMIHATRPFVESEWIQTKIEGQEVSGTVEHVGWWSPTVIRGDDREAVHIPNHKFTVSVVRNLTQKSHWRIKTHFGISHLDVNKIKHIVADMRKVLAKHPSVEQHRLHRRVFFDNIDPENQALLILVSCFVKTPHFEEYLRVKEVILLDLLKVISHHHARLATPIRSVQRLMDENESRHSPFRDVTARSETNRPFLLVEAAATSADDDKELVKVKAESVENGVDRSNSPKKVSLGVEEADSSSKVDLKDKVVASVDVKGPEVKERVTVVSDTKGISTPAAVAAAVEAPLQSSAPKAQLEGLDSMGLNAGDITLLGAAFEKPPAKIPEGPLDSGSYGDISSGDKVTVKASNEKLRVKNGIEKGGTKNSSEQSVTRTEITTGKGAETIQEQTTQNVKRPPGDKTLPKPGNEVLATEVKLSDAELHMKEAGADTLSPVPSDPISLKGKTDSLAGLENAASDDVWRPQGPSSGVPEKQEYMHPNHRAPSGSAADERVPPLQMPQSLEENVLLGVAIDGPKRTLPLDDELPSTSDQRIQTSVVSSIPRSQSVDDMLILGVALDGPKRTLPLGDDKSPSTEPRELVTPRNGNGGGTS